MKYVLDSSVAFKWLVPEPHTDKALRLRDDFLASTIELVAPDVFPTEIAHSLTRAERQRRIAAPQSTVLLTSLLGILPQLAASLPLLPRACQLSSLHRIGIYDCLYVALAERESCELITADSRLATALQGSFSWIIELSSLP